MKFKLLKKIGLYLNMWGVLSLVSCGDETQLYHNVYSPPLIRRVVDEQEPPPDPPWMSINSTLQRCVGIFGEDKEQLRSICPRNSETNDCNPSYSELLSTIERIVTNISGEMMGNVYTSLDEIISGNGSIEATALVIYRVKQPQEKREERDYYIGHLLVSPGEHYDAVQTYLQQGDFADGEHEYLKNFPFPHLRCDFHSWSTVQGIERRTHNVSWVVPSNIPPDKYNIKIIEVSNGDEAVDSILVRDGILHTYYKFDGDTDDISALAYAANNSFQEGITWVHDLTSGVNPHLETIRRTTYLVAMRAIYWPNAIEWSLE